MTETNLQRTSLAPIQSEQGARFVDFGDWELPVVYSSIIEETEAVRGASGLFDVSHMGRFFFTGEDAQKNLDRILTRDLSSLGVGRQRYSLLLDDEGGILDDLMVSRVGDFELMVVVNASNRDRDREWIVKHLEGDVRLADRTHETLMLALQGPESERILETVLGSGLADMKFLDVAEADYLGAPIIVSRSGYTGEDGFEVASPIRAGIELWRTLAKEGVKPCGLGARDLLRLEMAYPLHGHEISQEVRPHECGLEWTLSKKNPYIGKEKVEANPPRTELVGFELKKKGVPRAGCPVEVDGKTVGSVTSGGISNRLPNGFGLARVEKDSAPETLSVDIRGRPVPAKRVSTPFVADRLKRGA